MKIRFIKNFRHGGQGHNQGDEVTVDDGQGFYFCQVGAAERLDGEGPEVMPQPENVTLDVQNGNHGTSSTEPM